MYPRSTINGGSGARLSRFYVCVHLERKQSRIERVSVLQATCRISKMVESSFCSPAGKLRVACIAALRPLFFKELGRVQSATNFIGKGSQSSLGGEARTVFSVVIGMLWGNFPGGTGKLFPGNFSREGDFPGVGKLPGFFNSNYVE